MKRRDKETNWAALEQGSHQHEERVRGKQMNHMAAEYGNQDKITALKCFGKDTLRYWLTRGRRLRLVASSPSNNSTLTTSSS